MVVLFLAFWSALTAARGTPVGRLLHRVMVEIPAATINSTTRGHMLLAAGAFGFICIVTWFGEADGLRMLGMAVPDAAAWVTTFEITAYLDVISALIAVSTATRLRAIKLQVLTAIMPRFHRLAGKPRSRSIRQRCRAKAANDDDGGAVALAS
ncbi:hypothetical protein [Sphingomonas sp. CFBP 8760]|uniref:hypothetical protein n=1 Tax=Sphingomonas sp. CFBP 8760 TaxID=2775282 RepID=UPI00177DBB99|nr:hypothetical protein [Sphingomonas sp. CFBP 8760]MBD8546667.1 hypothetical protein [Sphingomonas sp. CFBP 8760]